MPLEDIPKKNWAEFRGPGITAAEAEAARAEADRIAAEKAEAERLAAEKAAAEKVSAHHQSNFFSSVSSVSN